MNLSPEQLSAIENGEAVPITAEGIACVVLRRDVFDRVRSTILAAEAPTEEQQIAVAWESGQSIGWDTPEMSEYDNYDQHRS